MAELISYEELRKIQNAEKTNVALQSIDETFFEKVREYIETKKRIISENEGKENTFAQQTVEKGKQELKNIQKILDDTCSRRQKKIFMQALTNVAAKVHNTEAMLPEEEELYNKTIAVLKENLNAFMSKFQRTNVRPELKKENKNLKFLRITEDISSFVWKDSNTYGPFKKEDMVNIPQDVGEILINQGKASEIENNGEQNK